MVKKNKIVKRFLIKEKKNRQDWKTFKTMVFHSNEMKTEN